MEQNWVQTHAGPFPEGIRNSVMNLRAALVIREEEAARGADSLLRVNEEGDMSERQERSWEESREREKTPTKFNWADDVDVSPTPIHNTCNERVLDATDNVSATGMSVGTIPIGPTGPPNTIVTTVAAPVTSLHSVLVPRTHGPAYVIAATIVIRAHPSNPSLCIGNASHTHTP